MVPGSTYRVQLHSAFTFDDAREIADYLRDLGITHVYCSPYLQAAKGSTHGYDVIDHTRVNEELGGADAHVEFVETLRQLGLSQILDVVPNHMAIGERGNAWWWDVLENGPSSRYAHYFDVDWEPPEARLHNLVTMPVLGDHYGRILENGELRMEREGGRFVVRYHEHAFPAAPKGLPDLLSRAALLSGSDELGFLADVYRFLPAPTATDVASVKRRHRDKEIAARQLADLCTGDPAIAEAIDRVLHEVNHDIEALDSMLSGQNFRLAWWRTAGRELGYRRFFDINTLVGLRTENEQVFRDTHCRIFEWLRDGILDGLRIDHPDGLRDPQRYFRRLHEAFPQAWLVAEKILEPGERLRSTWPIAGTTGYDFLNRAGNLFVDPRGEEPLTRFYAEFTGNSTDYHEAVRERKEQVLRATLGSDVNRLTAQFMTVCERHRRYRDFTRHEIHQALRALITSFPVYRTYVRPESGEVHDDDRRYVEYAVADAKKHRPELPPDLFDFIGYVLLLQVTGAIESEFVLRFQQFTGPAMAKGVEDTTFYVYNRLISLNEVGGHPGTFGGTLPEFHRLTSESALNWPAAMLGTSTHDTKRSEDVRCRIHLLSEMPDRWAESVSGWAAYNDRYRTANFPDRNIEYLFYQSLVGAWPIELERMLKYIEKASREAKTFTSWTDPGPKYDEALRNFVRSVFEDAQIMRSIGDFAAKLVTPGRISSLSQTLIKLTAPGVPDFYQGTEIWDLSLVDPDNRRPVDYDLRRNRLREVADMPPEAAMARSDEGFPKLLVTHRTLAARKQRPDCFGPGGPYTPVLARGNKSEHAVAFLRGEAAVTVVPRLVIGLAGDWQDTVLTVPPGEWSNVFTSEMIPSGEVRLSELLARFPVAFLLRK